MSLQSSYLELEKDELSFISELGWFATLAVVIIGIFAAMY